MKQFEQSGRENPLSQKFRGFNQGRLELKSSTKSNKCALKVSGGDKELEKVVHVDKPEAADQKRSSVVRSN